MYKAQKAATAIQAARSSNPPVLCWIDPGEDEGKLKAEKQRQYPMREILTIGWGSHE